MPVGAEYFMQIDRKSSLEARSKSPAVREEEPKIESSLVYKAKVPPTEFLSSIVKSIYFHQSQTPRQKRHHRIHIHRTQSRQQYIKSAVYPAAAANMLTAPLKSDNQHDAFRHCPHANPGSWYPWHSYHQPRRFVNIHVERHQG